MDNNTKKIIFYVLVFLLFYVFAKASIVIKEYVSINQDLIMILFGIIFSCVIYLLSKLTDSKDSFHFELTPEKKCDGGPYMYTSDPERQKLCSKFSPEDLAKYSCCPGFHGRPVWYERSDESNSNWANTMCDNGFDDSKYPSVL